MIVVAAGNQIDAPDRARPRFPPSEVERVAGEVGAALDRLGATSVVVSGAAGADLLVIAAARARGVAVHLVLPFPRERFRATSVAAAGAAWEERFAEALATATTLTELELAEDDEGYRATNQALIDRATSLAGGEPTAVLVVRPPPDPEHPSITDDLADRAAAAGIPTTDIDPRP